MTVKNIKVMYETQLIQNKYLESQDMETTTAYKKLNLSIQTFSCYHEVGYKLVFSIRDVLCYHII